ncbi:hypothetical protein MNEG_4485 [Monoraphidium neglectum]|uniref:BACK domain-containing protein n=1 Tax=Monoraphidium neglectum TaxID=145388 RepID=A0A0D2NDX7_9CHLO|nr:hypothetical protein MNEG_4485 [Monoraphidium neglectum]KIZ03476.1 hypothetical protein MNEG_4485 [Monoraphidium neglectum]|eukprot:XP_013902495.1 hypothetical protein MNEG_4485 [Monoraphidium neglectum]
MSGAVDFLDLYDTAVSSDVQIRITVPAAEDDAPPAKRQQLDQKEGQQKDREERRTVKVISGHTIILQKASDWAKCKLGLEWRKDTPGMLDVEVECEGEVEAAEVLLKTFYSTVDAARPLQGASHATLLQVLLLADRLRAERAVEAAVQVFVGSATAGAAGALDWDTVTAVYQLPPALADNPVLKPLFEYAAAALQERLGDLDATLLNGERRAQLLALPFAAMRQLLSDDRTCVSSENTVVYTIAAWIKKNASSAEQRAELAQCVRAPLLTPLYSAAVAAQLLTSWSPAISPADMHYALVFAGLSEAVLEAATGDKGVDFCAYLRVHRPAGVAVGAAAVSVSAKFEAGGSVMPVISRSCVMATRVGHGWGYSDVFKLGEISEWDEVMWRNKALVGQDGTVLVRFTIKDVK